jgi:transposase
MNIDQEKIEKAIIEQAVYEMTRGDDLYERVRNGINARIDTLIAHHRERCDLLADAIRNGAQFQALLARYTPLPERPPPPSV